MTNRSEMNRQARAIIARDAENGIIRGCELRFDGCMGTFGIAPAHRHKRVYYHTVEELSDPNEYVWADTHCHDIIEGSKELTLIVFEILKDEKYVYDELRILEALEKHEHTRKNKDGILRRLCEMRR